MSMGKQVPPQLLQEIAEGQKIEVENDAFNNFGQNNNNMQEELPAPLQQQQQLRPPHKFSPQYASYIGAKPRAQSSARIRLGGVF